MTISPEDEAFFRQLLLKNTREDLPLATEWELDKIYQFQQHRNYSREFEGLLFFVKKNEAGELYLDYYFETDDYCTHNRLSRDGRLTRLENIENQYGWPVYEDEEKTKTEYERARKHNESVRKILKKKGFDHSRFSSPEYKAQLTIPQLKHRWTTDWLSYANRLIEILKAGQAPASDWWPLTPEGKIDLRGYTAPQAPHPNNPVLQGPQLQKLKFINVDFSHGNWENSGFEKCHFEDCLFDSARMRDIRFNGCTFTNMHFKRTDFGQTTFNKAWSFFFQSRKVNFSHVTFEKCNFSNAFFFSQELQRCSFNACKTGFLHIDDCRMENIRFTGNVHNLFFAKNKVQQVDFRESFMRGVSFEKQLLGGFLLPEGDSYYIFRNEAEEIAWLANLPLEGEEKKVRDTMVAVWTFENRTINRFTDVHWLEAGDIETGKRILSMLKNRS